MPAKYLTKGSLIIHNSLFGINVGIVYDIDYYNQKAMVCWQLENPALHPNEKIHGQQISDFYDLPQYEIYNGKQ